MIDNTMASTLLLVDDKRENLFALERILEDSAYTLLQTTSGKEALRLMYNELIDLVILDVNMPEMDGFQVAELMQKSPKTHCIPIIFLTAMGKDSEYRNRGYELGAKVYLPKPIDPDVLRQKIQYVLKLNQFSKLTASLYNRRYRS